MSNPITILPICMESTLATIKDLEAKIAGWSAALDTPLASWQRETYALYIAAAEKQLAAFQQILISQSPAAPVASAIKAKLLTIAPDASAVMINATLHDIRQSCYWSADISLARLAAIYNGAAGLVSREATEAILNRLEDEEIAAYIAERTGNPAPAEPVAPDAFDELALEAYYQERDALEALVNLSPASEACAGCGALPGDGITASCWHSTGCGYLRELDERMADRGQYGRNA